MKKPRFPEGRVIKEGGKHTDYCGCNDCRLVEKTKEEFRRALFFARIEEKKRC